MRKIVDYKILKGSIDNITSLVQLELDFGLWQPLGGVAIIGEVFVQTMVQYEVEYCE